jgi:ComF family protein
LPRPEAFRHVAYRLYQLVWSGLDWLYPPLCGGCGKSGIRWCLDCQSCTERVPETACVICGQILSVSGICYRCRKSPPSYISLKSWAIFAGPVRNAIHRLKYEGDIALGEILSRPLIQIVNTTGWEIDAVVPVPIGIARKAERGYNQASIIGLPLALGIGAEFRPKWLVKVRETRSQVGLTLKERQENLKEAFAAPGEEVVGKAVLVIDDVTTSGATMEACSSALKRSGVAKVFGLTLARSVFSDTHIIN